ncbi:hypothetical protein [Chloroflexus sp.]|uniref:hypothetical protein n=1 Tax=Chloroflexus sp. TaxID=1904827 RepID=UPI00257C4F78|nr:hypothetical protein [Chloroflexus sp.]
MEKQKRKPAHADVSGLKWAISTAAFAVTIGGWGWLAAQNPPAAIQETVITADSSVVAAQSLPDWLAQAPALPVLPTVAPLNLPNAPTNQSAPQAAPVTAPAVAPASAQPALREVTVPAPAPRPAPAARTRSSR